MEADYRLGKLRTEDPAVVEDCITCAQNVAARTQRLREEFQDAELRQAFVDAITAYRKKVNRRV